MSHPQAYFSASDLIAASPSFAPASLDLPRPGGDALLVIERPGHGLVAALTTGDFTHVVTGLDRPGIELWQAPFWRTEPRGELIDLPDLPTGPLDLPRALEHLRDAPREALLDAALAGTITLVDPDAERRAAWIAWLTATLPGPLTFTTFTNRPLDLRVCATTPEHAGAFSDPFDARAFAGTPPSRYARFAAAIADRNPDALAPAPDPIALAVHAGATDLLDPSDLPRALDHITALVERGEIATAARAAAALGTHTTALVLAEVPGHELEVVAEPEPEPTEAEVIEPEAIVPWTPPTVDTIEDAVVVDEPEAIEVAEVEPVEITSDSFEAPDEDEPEPIETAALEEAPDADEPDVAAVESEPAWFEVPAEEIAEPEPVEVTREETFGDGPSLHDLEETASLDELIASDPLEAPADDEPCAAPESEPARFDLPADEVAEPEPVEVTREETFGEGVSLHDLEEAAPEGERSLDELMSAFASDPLEVPAEPEAAAPEEVPVGERSLDELMSVFTSDPLEAPADEIVEVTREETFGEGLSLHDLEEAAPAGERSLDELMSAFASDPLDAPPHDEVLEEEEVGMSLAELEASLAGERVEESEVGMSLEEFEASLKRERET